MKASTEKQHLDFRVLMTPGHTRGHVVFICENAIFSGDTLFGGGHGALFEGTYWDMLQNFNMLLSETSNYERRKELLLFPGHEYTAMIMFRQLSLSPETGLR